MFVLFMGASLLCSCKQVVKKISKESSGEIVEWTVKKSIKEIAASNKIVKFLLENFERGINKNFAEDIIAEVSEEGLELTSRQFPTTKAILKKKSIIAKAGSTIESGPVNEFLNFLIPNFKYYIDDCFEYETDRLGRVITAYGDRTKAFNTLKRNPQRNSAVQSAVIEQMGGTKGVHQSGHLFANSTGGPNELINQVPMLADVNMHGRWRELELMEEAALKEGKQVFSKRKLLYKGDEMGPYAIEFTSIIDGKAFTEIVKVK